MDESEGQFESMSEIPGESQATETEYVVEKSEIVEMDLPSDVYEDVHEFPEENHEKEETKKNQQKIQKEIKKENIGMIFSNFRS